MMCFAGTVWSCFLCSLKKMGVSLNKVVDVVGNAYFCNGNLKCKTIVNEKTAYETDESSKADGQRGDATHLDVIAHVGGDRMFF